MAGLVCELATKYPEVEVSIVPGVSAAQSGAAILGAPLTHDFAAISLSDLLTPWEQIAKRLACAAEGDFCIALYNPSSKKRAGYLKAACGILLRYRSPDTVCGVARRIGRDGENTEITTLEKLPETQADMFTTVFIGNSKTKVIGGRMVTPRGYQLV
jgi:precorrin-3B C17-methyltransferase